MDRASETARDRSEAAKKTQKSAEKELMNVQLKLGNEKKARETTKRKITKEYGPLHEAK